METKEKINSLFPEENKIPQEFLMQPPVNQTEYLVSGELHQWNGPMLSGFSPYEPSLPQKNRTSINQSL